MINVFEPYITLRDKLTLFKSINKKNISGSSNQIEVFEKLLSNTFNRKHTSVLVNGSIALDSAFQLIKFKSTDEVILPSFTIISCLSAVIRAGAKPVFCDVDELTWNMTLENVKQVFTKNTKAVLMVHTYGLTAEAIEIEEFCREKNLFLVEDAAEAHGQLYKDRKCGSFGDVTTFSFYANKHITTGEGGAILTNNLEYDKKIKQLRNLDFVNTARFQHKNLYWNYRMGGLQAALGSSQIQNLDNVIKHKQTQAKIYLNLLDEYKNLFYTPVYETVNSRNNFWVFGIVLKQKGIRDLLMNKLLQSGIETRPFFWPLHLQEVEEIRNLKNKINLPVTEFIGMNGLYLPMGPHINKKKQKFIVNQLIEFLS